MSFFVVLGEIAEQMTHLLSLRPRGKLFCRFGLTLIMVSNEVVNLASKTVNFSAEDLYRSIEPGMAMSFEYLDFG